MGVISCKTDRVKEVVKAKVVNQVKYSMWIVCTCMVVGLQKKKKKKKPAPLQLSNYQSTHTLRATEMLLKVYTYFPWSGKYRLN